MDKNTAFAFLANGIGGNSFFPKEDANDLHKGALYIPGEVTIARRKGDKVMYNSKKQEWTMPDGSIIK